MSMMKHFAEEVSEEMGCGGALTPKVIKEAQRRLDLLLIPAVTSLADLRYKAAHDSRYAKLAMVAAQNLGGVGVDLGESLRWLDANAAESAEACVVSEINFCRDLVRE